jgi:hypothetical protein
MLFSSNKKLQRDRNAGLVFRWRGGYSLNRGGLTIAFILTAMVFSAGFIMLNVYAKPNTVPSRYRASMIQLGNVDDDLTWWIERNSPSLPVMDEYGDNDSDQSVNALLMEDLKEAKSGAYQYADVEMKEIEINQEEAYSLDSRGLPPLSRLMTHGDDKEVSAPEVSWELKVSVNDGLAKRLPVGLVYGDWISEKWRGRSVRLVIVVDARGKVLVVNPSEWNESKTVREFENWAYTIQFKPAEDEEKETVTGVMTLSYSPVDAPLDVKEDKVKEEQP